MKRYIFFLTYLLFFTSHQFNASSKNIKTLIPEWTKNFLSEYQNSYIQEKINTCPKSAARYSARAFLLAQYHTEQTTKKQDAHYLRLLSISCTIQAQWKFKPDEYQTYRDHYEQIAPQVKEEYALTLKRSVKS
jgi:hypothetical protein